MSEYRLTADQCTEYARGVFPDNDLGAIALATNLFFYYDLVQPLKGQSEQSSATLMKSGPILSDTLKDSVGDAVAEEALFAGYKWVDEQVVQKKAS